MERTILSVQGMTCGGCAASVTRILTQAPGVRSAHVDLAGKAAEVEFDSAQTNPSALAALVNQAGFQAQPLP